MSEPTHKSKSQQRTLVTEDFRQNHERIFGERPRTNRRSRTVYPSDGSPPYEVSDDWEETVPEMSIKCDLYMDGLRATDGTDISSKAKRREYMNRKGLADTSDFTEHWKKAAVERERVLSGEADSKWRKETIGKMVYEARKQGRIKLK
jgi:hypothetical protein